MNSALKCRPRSRGTRSSQSARHLRTGDVRLPHAAAAVSKLAGRELTDDEVAAAVGGGTTGYAIGIIAGTVVGVVDGNMLLIGTSAA